MILKKATIFFLFLLLLSFFSCENQTIKREIPSNYFFRSSQPYTRWWWFASIIKKEDIKYQLDWIKKNNFGGVEVAWIYPVNRKRGELINNTPRQKWLSPEWKDVVAYAKQYADSIGVGCDFTFGSGWPFGDTEVSLEDATQAYKDTGLVNKRTFGITWDFPAEGFIINHLDSNALARYSKRMGDALMPALKGSTSGLFCDSWEVYPDKIWTTGFDKVFQEKFWYDIKPYMDSIYSKDSIDARYDYMKLLSDYVIDQFYKPFTNTCHRLNAFSRVQCSGAPTDLMTAYSMVDVPESEAMLYEPNFSAIVASAACLSSKKEISSETFTCIYGFPRKHKGEEQVADLKLVADAMFAHGVNQIFWHGMPYNPIGIDTNKFFASVHVGSKGALSKDLPAFNKYMGKVSGIMKEGKSYSDVAVYIPMEDAWIAGVYPDELQIPGSWSQYELRYIKTPEELKGYGPLWINNYFLKKGILKNGSFYCGDAVFSSLLIDVEYMDSDALNTVLELATKGFPVCLKRMPKEPGKIKSGTYKKRALELTSLKNVSDDFKKTVAKAPLIEGNELPDFWCKKINDTYYIFFANPLSQNLHYPISYGQSFTDKTIEKNIKITVNKKATPVTLNFKPFQSILLSIDGNNKVDVVDITYDPPVPIVKNDEEKGRGK